jgi:hypothetical protein
MCFGGVLEKLDLLQSTLHLAKSTSSLIASTITIGTNIIIADQYIALVLPGRMYRAEYEKRGRAPVNLSRAGRRRHPDLGASAIEHLRCVYGRDAGSGDPELPAVLLLQPADAAAGDLPGLYIPATTRLARSHRIRRHTAPLRTLSKPGCNILTAGPWRLSIGSRVCVLMFKTLTHLPSHVGIFWPGYPVGDHANHPSMAKTMKINIRST